MAELIFELGCEELPATAVRRAYTDLEQAIVSRLAQAGLPAESSTSLGTPRRLIVQVTGLAARQPDTVKESRGPGVKAAYDAEGKPTKALEGFCRGQGVSLDQVRTEGDYVWISQEVKGKATGEVLAEILPEAVRSLSFDKTMRWGQGRMRFARPIRWILAAFDGQAIAFELEGVGAGTQSKGHRFYDPSTFDALNLSQLVEGLRQRKVEPDPAKREVMIREGAAKVATGTPELPAALVDENVFLTEWPSAVEGTFPEAYQALPDEVLITAMVKHERFFPVRGADHSLLNRFISIRNAGVDESVRAGNEWVLNARFNDAKFFFEEDSRFKLDDFLAKTEKMTFQEKLGTVRERANRLSTLSSHIATQLGADASQAEQAGLYAKADLSTGLVSELANLQGIVGGHYGAREGFAPEVCEAIASQYSLERAMKSPLGLALLLADQWDKLAGFLGIGLLPTGSSDPFGLRRSVTYIIESAWAEERLVDLERVWCLALDQYPSADREKATLALRELFTGRYSALLAEARFDCLEAVLAAAQGDDLMDPRKIRWALQVCEGLADQAGFITAASRPLNILAAAEKKGIRPEPGASMANPPEPAIRLREAKSQAQTISPATEAKEAIQALLQLEKPIHDFFETTMVMDEDVQVRDFNLNLLGDLRATLLKVADFTKVVVPGDQS